MLNLSTETYGDVIVSVNPHVPIDPSKIIYEHHFGQPLSVLANDGLLAQLAGEQWRVKNIPPNIDVVGAWTGYGFHEDGLLSSYAALRRMGVALPEWKARNPPVPELTEMDHAVRKLFEIMETLRRAAEPFWVIRALLVVGVCQLVGLVCIWYGFDGVLEDLDWAKECWSGTG